MTELVNKLPANTGILICGHGSRAAIAEKEFSLLAKGLRQRFPNLPVEYGFLEYSCPNIHMALDALREKEVQHIIAVPGMLFTATHVQNDIPSVLTTYMQKHPELTIEYGHALGLLPEMITAYQARILEALGMSDVPEPGELYDTLLVVVGRGTSVTDANAEVAKLSRIVCENLGFGWSQTVYSGVTFPSVGRGLEMALAMGFRKVVVAPYFLFGGHLINRINAYVDKVAEENPQVEFIKADYLRDQAHVVDAIEFRIEQTLDEQTGLMQDFRDRLERGEVDVHHHHAEYVPEGHHHHSHDHSHDHVHAPYKHIAHPLGPRTMINENLCCCFMKQFPQHVIDEEKSTTPENDRTPVCKMNTNKVIG